MDQLPNEQSQAQQMLDQCLNRDAVMELVGFFEVLIEIDRDLKLNKQNDVL